MDLTARAPLAGIALCRDLPPMRTLLEPALDPELRLGTLLDGRFNIRELISRSRLSSIYRAEDLDDGRRSVAIKLPLLKVESDPAGFARFLREEEVGRQLDHPSLLKFIPVEKKTGRPHFVTEFLDGCTLADLLHETRPLPEDDARCIAAVVGDALGRLHAAGFIHRDLKPGNIVLCHDGSLRVIDFGQAAAPERKRSLFAVFTPILGTPTYMAPEQVENRPNDERTDIYCLGVVLYEMLTGVVPFQNADAWIAAHQRTTGDPIAPRQVNPSLSRETEEIVLHAMRRDPKKRYQTMAEFCSELRASECVRITGLAERLQQPRWKLSFHGTPLLAGLLLGLGAILVLAALFGALVVFHPGR